jgi:acetoacetate decarboxylase
MLTIEYRTDPDRVAELLPGPLQPAEDDPGAVALIWADWQSCSDNTDELLDPARTQYKETFVVVRCRYQGTTYSRAVYIWVDKDFAMARGHLQGYPKKMGEIWMTRPITHGRAGPRLEPGGRFGATLSTWGRRIAEARFTITDVGTEDPGFVNGHPMLHSRQMPAIEMDGRDSLDELVTMRGFDVELGPVYVGQAEVALPENPTEELHHLAPIEMIGATYRQIGTSMRSGSTVWAAPNPMAAAAETDNTASSER